MSGDLLGHAVEVHIQLQGIHVLAADTATLVPVVGHLVFHQARSPSKLALLLNSVSRKRLKLQKQLLRPRIRAIHRLPPRVPRPLISPALNRITTPERVALLLHLNRRRDPELPHQPSLSHPQRGHPRRQQSTRPAGTGM